MFRLVVAGDRRLADYDLVRDTLDRLLVARLPEVLIVSGGASGADALGERYAREHGLLWIRIEADWHRHGRKAGPLRNAEMARNADALVLFDGGGPGSRSMHQVTLEAGLPLRVVTLG